MIKRNEIARADSCLNRAKEDEMVFVLLGRDAAVPATILFWVKERIRLGKNKETDSQISEALAIANEMITEQERTASTRKHLS